MLDLVVVRQLLVEFLELVQDVTVEDLEFLVLVYDTSLVRQVPPQIGMQSALPAWQVRFNDFWQVVQDGLRCVLELQELRLHCLSKWLLVLADLEHVECDDVH
jgi:hypothetical protein